jgi:hypothetical protein
MEVPRPPLSLRTAVLERRDCGGGRERKRRKRDKERVSAKT